MSTLNDLTTFSACELLAAYRASQLSPVDVAHAVLRLIEQRDAQLHATWAVDAESALAAARASEARWAAGTPLHCGGITLDGVPAMLKENIATRGQPVPLGTAATDGTPAAHDAPPAARLREAGAVFIGKTTMPDYGMLSSGLSSFHATARNPWDLSKTPGGSSAGAAAAAAAGYGPLHLGTDIGGSLRLPAGWCGIATLKPSHGRVPIDPPYLGRVAGPMARTVDDCALMMGVLSQPDARDATSLPYQAIDWMQRDRPLAGLRMALLLDAGYGLPTSPEVRMAVAAAAKLLADAGAVIEPIAPWVQPEWIDGIDRFWRARASADLDALPPKRRERVLPFIRAWAAPGATLSGRDVFMGYTAANTLGAATAAATQRWDYVLSPVAPLPAFDATLPCPTNDPATAMHHIGYTVPYNMSGQPAASVNCGYADGGLPIGLQIAGRRFDDLGVLQVARCWEQLRAKQRTWPV